MSRVENAGDPALRRKREIGGSQARGEHKSAAKKHHHPVNLLARRFFFRFHNRSYTRLSPGLQDKEENLIFFEAGVPISVVDEALPGTADRDGNAEHERGALLP